MEEKQKKKENISTEEILSIMNKIVKRKLETCKIGTPVLITFISAILAYLFSQKHVDGNAFYTATILIGICILMLALIVITLIPKEKYKKCNNKFNEIKEFQPSDISTYLALEENEYIVSLEKYIGKDLREEEKQKALDIKDEVNEYVYKKRILKIVSTVFIFGALYVGSLLIIAGIDKLFLK